MRGGGSGSGVAGAGPETGSGLTGAGAAGSAVAIDAVRIGAASWTRLASCEAGSGAETGDGLAGGSAVAIEAVRVGAASRTSDLVLRRSWTRTPAASAASSVMGTMSIDFIAMGIHRHQETVIDLAERVLTMCFTPHFSSSTRTRWSRADPGSPGVFGVSRHQASSFETKRFDVGALARGHGTIFELPRRPKSTGGGKFARRQVRAPAHVVHRAREGNVPWLQTLPLSSIRTWTLGSSTGMLRLRRLADPIRKLPPPINRMLTIRAKTRPLRTSLCPSPSESEGVLARRDAMREEPDVTRRVGAG
jgi:hypothetical protein